MSRSCLAAVAGIAACLGGATARAVEPPDRPNVLMIVVDDMNDWVG